MSPGMYYSHAKKSWQSHDQAYVLTSETADPIPQQIAQQLWQLGAQNERHNYRFTSLEAAVSNAIQLAHDLLPHTTLSFPIRHSIELRTVLAAVIAAIAMFTVMLLHRRRR